MDFLLPLTIIGFIISFFSISEEYKKRNLLFKFSWLDKSLLSIIFLGLIGVIFYQNYQIIQEPELTYTLFNIEFTYAYLSSFVAFILAAIIVIYFIVKLHSKKLNQRTKFIENSLDNLKKRKYAELSADLDIFHDELLKKYKRPKVRQFYLLKYIRYWVVYKLGLENKKSIAHKLKSKKKAKLMTYSEFRKEEKENFDRFGHLMKSFQSKDKNWKTNLKNFFDKLRFIKNNKIKYCDILDKFYNELANDSDYIEYLIDNNFNSALELLKVQTNRFNKEKLWDKIGRYLITNKNSKLYTEFNEDYSGNRDLLNFLFKDTSKCAEFLTWKPIGDYVIEYIENQKKKEEDENNYQESNYNLVKQNSPIYTGIRFFDYMVKTALEQNTADHMWLYYVGYFVEKMLRNIKYEEDARGEFASMYEYYIYEIFSAYDDWITYAINNDNYTIEYNEQGGPNIIQNVINSFVFAMHDVQKSDKLRDDFKSYLREIFIDTYFELATCNKQGIDNYVDYFKKCLREKIQSFRDVDRTFVNFLKVPVDNPHQRSIWDKGAHYTMNAQKRQKLDDFKNFLNLFLSNNGEANQNV